MHKDTSWYLFLQSSSSVVTQNWLHCEYHLTHCLANQPEGHKTKSSNTVMKSVAKRHGRFTLSPPHRSHFASCFLCDVDVSEVHSNLRVLRVPKSAWVPRSGDLKSPKLLLSSIPAMHQGVETLQMQKCPSSLHQLLHVELWIFLYLQNSLGLTSFCGFV